MSGEVVLRMNEGPTDRYPKHKIYSFKGYEYFCPREGTLQ